MKKRPMQTRPNKPGGGGRGRGPGAGPKVGGVGGDAVYEKRLAKLSELVDKGDGVRALMPLIELTQKFPKDPRGFYLLARAQSSLGRHNEAFEAGRRSVELLPDDPAMRTRYGHVLQNGGRYEEALLEYERALFRMPGNLYLLRAIATVYVDMGDHEKALERLGELEKAMEATNPNNNDRLDVMLIKGRMSPKSIPAREVIDEMTPLLELDGIKDSRRTSGHTLLGMLNETIGEYDAAFGHWNKMAAIKRRSEPWDPDVYSRYIDELIKCWSRVDEIPVSTKHTGEDLIFIVGMMRSGTSLTEQMIAQLDGVVPGGEMNAISRAGAKFEPRQHPLKQRPLPITFRTYTQRVINAMSVEAMQAYREVSQHNAVTDKQPTNFLYVPMINRIFPGAKIIHLVRDPMDNCLSNYQHVYARPHPYTYDLYALGRYHKDYQRVMQAWRELESVEFMDLEYETLVAEPEAQTKRICEHLGRPWSEAMLNFHESSRSVNTASRDQVRKPLYKSSVKKYERYEQHLGELKRGLGIEG
jgi:tetratricopeptide (TPR) repeat protein